MQMQVAQLLVKPINYEPKIAKNNVSPCDKSYAIQNDSVVLNTGTVQQTVRYLFVTNF